MIYLISGNSYHLIDSEVKKIIKDNDCITMNLNMVSVQDIIKEASYFLLTDKKYIIVSNASIFGNKKTDENDTSILLNYLENPNENTIIIFTTLEKVDLRKKIAKKIKEKYKFINIEPLDRNGIVNLIKRELQNKGFNIGYDEILYIINNTYDSLDLIINELEKIYLYYDKPTTIKLDDLKKIIGNSIDSNIFHFINNIISKDLNAAVKGYKDLKIYKTEEISLIIILANEYRKMYYVKKYQNMNKSLYTIAKDLKLMDWQVNKLYNSSLNYNEAELLKNIKLLNKLDVNIKKGICDKETGLISFMITSCQ